MAHLIIPNNATLHLARRGHELMNANMLAALVAITAAERCEELDAARLLCADAIANAQGVGIRAQSFAERERDLLEANNKYLERARSAEAALRLALPVCEDAYEDAKLFELNGKTPEALESTAAALAALEAVKSALAEAKL